jgi:type II secretory pathway component PulM
VDLGNSVVLIGAVLGALAVIYKTVVQPARRFRKRVEEAIEILSHIREWIAGFEYRLEAIEDVVHQGKKPPPRARRGLKSL